MPMTQEQMVKLLVKHGFEVVKGGKGSHIKMTKPGQVRPIIIPHGELNNPVLLSRTGGIAHVINVSSINLFYGRGRG